MANNTQDASSPLKALNLAAAFLLEVVLLVAFCYWGFHASHSSTLQWLLGIGAPVGAIILWSVLAAPKSDHRLSRSPLAVFRVAIFTLAAACLFSVHEKTVAIIFEIISVLNIVLLYTWKQ